MFDGSGDDGYDDAILQAQASIVIVRWLLDLNGAASDADSNDVLRVAYPEYFDQPGASPSTLHQRFSRTGADLRTLLQALVRRDEVI